MAHPNILSITEEEANWSAVWEVGAGNHHLREVGRTAIDEEVGVYWLKEVDERFMPHQIPDLLASAPTTEITADRAMALRSGGDHDPRWSSRMKIAEDLESLMRIGYLNEDPQGNLVAEGVNFSKRGKMEDITIIVKPDGTCAAQIRNPFLPGNDNKRLSSNAYILPTGKPYGLRVFRAVGSTTTERKVIYLPETIVTQFMANLKIVLDNAREEVEELEELAALD